MTSFFPHIFQGTWPARKHESPLFPMCLFCRITPASQGVIVKTMGVQRIVGYGNVPAEIPEVEISKVRQIVKSGVTRTPWKYLPAGWEVRIDNGPLAGLEGFLERTGDDRKLVVSVVLLQRSVGVALDSATRVTPLSGRTNGIRDDRTEIAIRLAGS